MKYFFKTKRFLSFIIMLCMTLSLFATPQVYAAGYDPSKYSKNDVDAINAMMKSANLVDEYSQMKLSETLYDSPGRWKFVQWDSSTPKRVTQLLLQSVEGSGAIDASKLTELTYLKCSFEGLTSLNVKGLSKLTYLNCSGSSLTSLDLTGCTALTELYCEDNKLKTLDVRQQKLLEKVQCMNNQIKSLDVSGLTKLASLDCSLNQITSLDVSGLTKLESLNCSQNQLTSLKISGATSLNHLDCSGNNLTSLDISPISQGEVNCSYNKLPSQDAVKGINAEAKEWGELLIYFEPQNIKPTATPTASKVLVNGKSIAFEAYNIKGNNYFKLRDLAMALSGTNKQFEVTWNSAEELIYLFSGKAYTPVGGELVKGDGKVKLAAYSGTIIFLDDDIPFLTAYNIGGNNYFQLRDIMKALDVYVGWDSATSTITIDTNRAYSTQ